MPAGFPLVRQYIDKALHLIVVGASHDERMGIYDERGSVRPAQTDARGPQRKADGQKGLAGASIADARSMVDEVSADAAWSSVQLIFRRRSEGVQTVAATCPQTIATLRSLCRLNCQPELVKFGP